jgi:outer membrane murein-binding lipoprotein Lpp
MVEVSPIVARRSRISASSFVGSRDPRPVAQARDQALLSQNSIQLARVSGEIRTLSAQVNQLSNSLQAVRSDLAAQQALERQKERQEQVIQNRLAQQKLREGKESVVEQKIRAAVLAPAIKLGQKTQGALNSLSGFLFRLFGSWLTLKGVQTLNAFATGNTERLEKLKNQVITGVASYVALTSAIKGALVGFRGAFGKINLILLGISAIALFRDPIQNFVAMIWEKTKEIIRGIIDYVDEQTNGLLKQNFQTPSWLQASQQQQQQTSGNNILPTVKLVRGPDGTVREEPINQPPTEPMTGQGGPNSNLPINYPQGSQQPPTQEQQQPLTVKKARYRNIHQEEPVAQPTETVMGNKVEPEGFTPSEQPEESAEIKKLRHEIGEARADMVMNRISAEEFKQIKRTNEAKIEELGASQPTVEPSQPLTKEQQFRQETARREALPENQIGAKVTDPAVLAMIEQEKYIGRTGELPPNYFEPTSNRRNVAENIQNFVPEEKISVVPMEVPQEPPPAQEVDSGGGSISPTPAYLPFDPGNPWRFGAFRDYNVVT